MSIFETPKQKRCGKRGHGYVMLSESSVAISGCVYCGAYAGKGKVMGTHSYHPLDVTSVLVLIGWVAFVSVLATVCVSWLVGVAQ